MKKPKWLRKPVLNMAAANRIPSLQSLKPKSGVEKGGEQELAVEYGVPWTCIQPGFSLMMQDSLT